MFLKKITNNKISTTVRNRFLLAFFSAHFIYLQRFFDIPLDFTGFSVFNVIQKISTKKLSINQKDHESLKVRDSFTISSSWKTSLFPSTLFPHWTSQGIDVYLSLSASFKGLLELFIFGPLSPLNVWHSVDLVDTPVDTTSWILRSSLIAVLFICFLRLTYLIVLEVLALLCCEYCSHYRFINCVCFSTHDI